MKFGPVSVTEAAGAISAHSVLQGADRIKKGQVLGDAHIEKLVAAGVEAIIVARLEAGDIHEDDAATRLGQAMIGGNVRAEDAFTGRVNLFAEKDGVLFFDPDMLNRLNGIDEAVTCATLAPFARVHAGQMVATVKIIPFSVERDKLELALAEAGPVSVSVFKPHRAGLVATAVPGTSNKMLDKTARVLSQRLENLGSTLGNEIRCAHETEDIAASIRELIVTGHDPVIVFGASAIVDRRDMVPSGIEAAGGTIEHFGMPVDPGNLLLLAHSNGVRIVGAPGCARSPKENGFDLVLERMLAGLKVRPEDIMAMGAGGLYKEIESRPQPRAAKHAERRKSKRRIAALVLAAGQSRRMGQPNKLLQELGGKPLVRHAVEAALAGPPQDVVVVTGHQEADVQAALEGLDVRFVHNADFEEGLSTSLRAGILALDDTLDAVMVCLGDMPGITPALLSRMVTAYAPEEGRMIVVPTHLGKRGNPVLFSMRFRDGLLEARGDTGARHLLGTNEHVICEIEADENVALDVDTSAALEDAKRRLEEGSKSVSQPPSD